MYHILTKIIIVIILAIGFFVPFSRVEAVYNGSFIEVSDPSPGIKYVGTQFTLDIQVNTNGAGNGIDAIALRNLTFDQNKLEIISISRQNFATGWAVVYPTDFASNNFNTEIASANSTGLLRVDLGKIPSDPDFSSTSATTFLTITFLAKEQGTANFDFDFDGSNFQSGIFSAGVNELDTANTSSVTIQEDNTPPLISNCSPASGDTNVKVNTNVVCDVTDNETGVHLPGTTLTVNGTTYHRAGSGTPTYSYSSIANGYTLTVNPATNFNYNASISVEGSAQDNAYDDGPVLARNTGTLSLYTFDTEDDVDAPQILNRNPNSGAINVPENTNIVFDIRDVKVPDGYPGYGVDLSTVQVTVTAPLWGTQVYQDGDAEFSSSGTPNQYTITINPATDFPENTNVDVQVVADDLHPTNPNTLTSSYTFQTIDNTEPGCTLFSPSQNSVSVAASDNITFRCTDDGTGVDLASIHVIVDGVEYTNPTTNASDPFSYSGTASAYDFVINPVTLFPTEYAFEVIINVSDQKSPNPNTLPQLSYGLATGVATGSSVVITTTPQPTANVTQIITQELTVTREISQNITQVVTGTPAVITTAPIIQEQRIILTDVFEFEVEATEIRTINGLSLLNSDNNTVSVEEETIIIEGVTSPGQVIALFIEPGGYFVGTVADENGGWEIQVNNVFPQGTLSIYAVESISQESEDGKNLGNIDNQYEPDVSVTPIVETQVETEIVERFNIWWYILVFIIGFIIATIVWEVIIKNIRKRYEQGDIHQT